MRVVFSYGNFYSKLLVSVLLKLIIHVYSSVAHPTLFGCAIHYRES